MVQACSVNEGFLLNNNFTPNANIVKATRKTDNINILKNIINNLNGLLTVLRKLFPGKLPTLSQTKLTKLLSMNCYTISRMIYIILMHMTFVALHFFFEFGTVIFTAFVKLIIILITGLVHFCIVPNFGNSHFNFVHIGFGII